MNMTPKAFEFEHATNPADKLGWALLHARSGLRVFPVRPKTKVAAVTGWPDEATTDEGKIRSWWRQWPDANIGVAAGNGLAVIDADCKAGKPGLDSLEWMSMLWLPSSFSVKTPSGGMHVYLRLEQAMAIGNTVDKFEDYPGIDIRGDRGYVLGAGSSLEDGDYSIANAAPIAAAPADFVRLVEMRTTPRRKEPADKQPAIELDQPHNIRNAIDYLVHMAPEAVEGAGGDQTTWNVAVKLRDLGIAERTALELMLDHWNEVKAYGPWHPEELEQKVANAYQYANGVAGGATAEAEFGDLGEYDIGEPPSRATIETANAKPKPKSRLYSISLLEAAEKALAARSEPLVDGYLDKGTLAVFFGESGIGKTFALLDMLFSISTGQPWAGRTTARGHVVYLAAEGGAGIFGRAKALLDHRKYEGAPCFSVVPCPANLFDEDVDALIELARDARKNEGAASTEVIAIDTLARTMGNGDENSNKDMSAYIRNADRIREATGAAVILVHHTGKDQARGARGASALRAATDSEFEVRRTKAGLPQIVTTKQREMEPAAPVTFRLKPVSIGASADGRSLTSCVPEYCDRNEFLDLETTPQANDLLETLNRLFNENGGQSVEWRAWLAAYRLDVDPQWTSDQSVPPGCSDRHVQELRRSLLESGRVKSTTKGRWEPCG